MVFFKEGDDCAGLESTEIKRKLEMCVVYSGLGVRENMWDDFRNLP